MDHPIPETPPDFDQTRIIDRPDGFYWQDKETGAVFGPFPTLLDAVQDMNYDPETDIDTMAPLESVEDELGIASWIDPETGFPAEETPHLD